MRRMIEVKELKNKIVFGKDIGTKEVIMGVAEIPESLMVNGAHTATDEEKAWIEKYTGYAFFKFPEVSDIYSVNTITNSATTFSIHISDTWWVSDGSQFHLDALVEYYLFYNKLTGDITVTYHEF